MSKSIPMIGKKFGRLQIVERAENTVDGKCMWLCLCDCGNKKIISGKDIRTGHTRSCGCIHREQLSESSGYNLVGKVFGRLTVEKEIQRDKGKGILWLCGCSCGNKTKVRTSCLMSGNTLSCGCYFLYRVSGVNSYHYNSTLTEEDRVSRRLLPQYASWSKKVRNRDRFVCQLCASKKRPIVAHHLNAWNWAKEDRLNVDNGITLCERCHKIFHAKYGNKNNTRGQFELFRKSRIIAA